MPNLHIPGPRAGQPTTRRIIGLCAAKNPVLSLGKTVESLFAGGASRVVVVDDGSDEVEAMAAFEAAQFAGAEIIHLPENVGKSNALRAGLRHLDATEVGSYIVAQVDDDTVAGNMTVSAKMIEDGKADIVDVRVQTFPGTNLVSTVQELQYWLISVTIKPLQDVLRSRLWLSGASLLYTREAAEVLILEHSVTQTEDTEGRFRAIGAGLRVRYCMKREAMFLTMVPETLAGVHKQWGRWALGNGQVIRLHGLGGGNTRIALVHALSWMLMLVAPVLQFFIRDWALVRGDLVPSGDEVVAAAAFVPAPALTGPLLSVLIWMSVFGLFVGTWGAYMLRRPPLVLAGVLIPLMSLYWAYHSVRGLLLAVRHPVAQSLTWTPPKRQSVLVIEEATA